MKLFARLRSRDQARSEAATEQTVYWAYRLLLGREPDPDGFSHFVELTREGLRVDELVRHFRESQEYRNKEAEERHAQSRESEPVAVDLGGYLVCLRKTDLDFGRGIFAARTYEEHVRQAVRDHLHAGDTALDIGANIGVITFLAASCVGSNGRVIAVEPNPDNLQLLYRGVLANCCTNVTVIPCAASDSVAVVSLTGGTSNTHLIPAAQAGAADHLAQAVPLQLFLNDVPRLDFVKIDIEGHEPRALAGMHSLIERHRPAVLTEFNPRCLADLQDADPAAYLDSLLRLYPRLRALSAFGDDAMFESAAALMDHWRQRDAELNARGVLPAGMLHFDLLATP